MDGGHLLGYANGKYEIDPLYAYGCRYDYYDGLGAVYPSVFMQNWVLPGQECPRDTPSVGSFNDGDKSQDLNGRLWCAYRDPTIDLNCPISKPILAGVAQKVLSESDYAGAGAHALELKREYRSYWIEGASVAAPKSSGRAAGWIHSFGASISQQIEARAWPLRRVTRPNGKVTSFYSLGNSWVNYEAVRDTLTELKSANGLTTGWTYKVFEDDSTETYSATGKLLSIKQRNGWTTTLTYSDSSTPVANYLSGSTVAQPGLLISVKNHFGRELKFVYNAAGQFVQLLPPGAVKDGAVNTAQAPIRYSYDTAGNLATVTWQDGNVKRYHYEDSRFASALTGVTDEAGVRIRTYAYDAQGRAISSEQAGGAERYTFNYLSNGQTTVTAPDTSTRTYTFQNTGGVIRPTAVTAPCPLCGSTAASTQYDASGNVTKRVEHDGTVNFFTYDAKGRETEKATFPASYATSATRPALNLATQVISTQWHATWNLPTKIAEPGKITAFTYANANATTGMGAGNLTGRSETQTTDATGAAKFTAAQAAGTPIKSTGWSYNTTSSLPTTIVERETAFGGTTAVEKGRWTLAHNNKGDPTKITDVTNSKAVSLTSYDIAGRLLQSADENQVVAIFNYNARGLSTSVSYGSQLSSFEYTQFGAIKKFKFGTGYEMEYFYDASQNFLSTTEAGVLPWGNAASSVTKTAGSIPSSSNAMNIAGASTAAVAAGLVLPYAFVQPSVIAASGGRIIYPPWYKPSPAPDPLTATVCVPSSPPPPVPRGPSPGESCRNLLQTCWAAASKVKSITAYSICIAAYAGCLLGEAGGGGTP
ncbi:MAG: hypothetical protein ACRCV9_02245 [Burkholderiaceae bacterium]